MIFSRSRPFGGAPQTFRDRCRAQYPDLGTSGAAVRYLFPSLFFGGDILEKLGGVGAIERSDLSALYSGRRSDTKIMLLPQHWQTDV